MKSIFLIVTLTFLFVGNVGFNVFKHICKEDGVLVSYFVAASEDHCDEHKENIPPCCENEKEEKDCCNDEVDYFKIKLDFSNSNDELVNLQQVEAIVDGFSYENARVIKENEYAPNYANPPPLSGREIRLKKQVWII